MRDTTILYWVQTLAALGVALLGGLDRQLTALMLLIVFDVITGLAHSCVEAREKKRKWFNRDKAVTGAITKMVYFVLIAVGVQMDKALGFNGIRIGFIGYLSLLEIASIFEHAGGCGVPIPNVIAEAVKQAKAKMKIGGRK
ncbi:MAG TPA: phage holin family protein [Armatimonadota bacterium]|nr:phage holin family protein [Armatimonadota bacterium]